MTASAMSRYRLPVDAVALIFATVGIAEILRSLRTSSSGSEGRLRRTG